MSFRLFTVVVAAALSTTAVAAEPTCTDLASSYRQILEAHPGSMTAADIEMVLTNVKAGCDADNQLVQHAEVATCVVRAQGEEAWMRCLKVDDSADFYSWFGKLVRR